MFTTCSMAFAYEDWSDSLRRQQEKFDRMMEYNQRVNQIEQMNKLQDQMQEMNSYHPTHQENYYDSYQKPTYVQEKPLYKFGNSSEL